MASRSALRGVVCLVLLALAVGGCGGSGSLSGAGTSGDKPATSRLLAGLAANATIPGRYIVTLREQTTRGDVAHAHGVTPDVRYGSAVHGFAGRLSDAQVRSLEADPDVVSVEPDRVAVLDTRAVPEAVISATGSRGTEVIPTGISRIGAELNPRTDVSTVGVAIIDTGLWREHEDLNVQGGCNVTTADATAWEDDNGHGTHVAGIVAAKAGNGVGVRGVAPNARLYGVKVMDSSGSGALSWIVAGVDWVAANSKSLGIRVANMSLQLSGQSSSLDSAIHAAVAGGVTFVVAAGNEGMDGSGLSPANHPDVMAISAIADSDGKPGGLGASTLAGNDDVFAPFSNFGRVIALAAPGVNILSTYMGDATSPNGRYASMSGTSMASPHVTGAAAQIIASNPALSPAQVRAALIQTATLQSPVAIDPTGARPRGGFSGDPDIYHEPLVDAAALYWRHPNGF